MDTIGAQLLLAALGTQGSGLTGDDGFMGAVEPDASRGAPGFGAVSPPPLQADSANSDTIMALNCTFINPPEHHPVAGDTLALSVNP
jgi:hypothetical protein